MNDNELVQQVIEALKADGHVMVTQEWMQMLTELLHDNIEIINHIVGLAEIECAPSSSLHLRKLSKRLSYIAFTIERVAMDQE